MIEYLILYSDNIFYQIQTDLVKLRILIEYLIIYSITPPQSKREVDEHEHWDCLELDPRPTSLIFFFIILVISRRLPTLLLVWMREIWVINGLWGIHHCQHPQVWASTKPDKMEVDDHSAELTSLHLDMHLWDPKQVEWRGSSSTNILHLKSDGDMVPYIGNRKRWMERTLIVCHGGEKKKK